MPPRVTVAGPRSTPQVRTEPSPSSDAEMIRRHHQNELKSRVAQLFREVIHPLKTGYKGTHISKDSLKKLRISCVDLDLVSGKPRKGGEQFIQPIPPAKMEELLSRTQPWRVRAEIEYDQSEGLGQNPQWEATFLLDFFKIWAQDAAPGKGPGIMGTQTKWTEFNLTSPFLSGKSSRGMEWLVTGVMQRLERPDFELPYQPSTQDRSKPHVMGFLTDNAALKEDVLSTSEVITVMFLSCTYILVPEHAHHRVVPVTLLSASDKSVRIVQGVVDVRSRQLEIRKSPIIRFNKGVRNNYGAFLTLLGWMIGDPVGKTT